MPSLRVLLSSILLSFLAILLVSSSGCSVSTGEDVTAQTVVAFHAEWCSACKRDLPALEKLRQSDKYDNVLILDYDEHPETVKRYNIKRVPTYLVVDEHGVIYRTTNVHNLE